MRRALIGHTGFVGSHLAAGGDYQGYNSRNIEAMAGQSFDEVICAGVSAVKYLANQDPDTDAAGIKRLTDVLATVKADHFTLVSTIDVYPDPSAGLDESATLSGLPNHAYGRHRLALEARVAQRFPASQTVRLPALFGPGLKKNMIFDLLTGNQTDRINPAARFQWYPLARLADDLALVRASGLGLVNLFTEPLAMQAIIGRHFGGASVGEPAHPAPLYDTRTRHAAVFGGTGDYCMSAPQVLAALDKFIAGWTHG